MTDSLKSFVKRRRLADFKSSLMAFPSLATLKRIQTDLFDCSTCLSFVWEVKRENESDKGGGVRKMAERSQIPFPPPSPPSSFFSFDFCSAFVRLYTLLFETQTKKTASYSVYTYNWYNMAIDYHRLWLYVLDIRNGNCMITTCSDVLISTRRI